MVTQLYIIVKTLSSDFLIYFFLAGAVIGSELVYAYISSLIWVASYFSEFFKKTKFGFCENTFSLFAGSFLFRVFCSWHRPHYSRFFEKIKRSVNFGFQICVLLGDFWRSRA